MTALFRRSISTLRFNVKPPRLFHTSRDPSIAETGLYGINHLKTPQGFHRFVDDAIQRSDELVKYISGVPSSIEIVRAMDEISDTVCSVADSAELCRHTHPDRKFVDGATMASMRIQEYIHLLNTNLNLYNAVKKAELDQSLLDKEAKKTVHDLRVDFEKGGIHLCEEKKDRINNLNIEIAELCAQFSENISKDPGHVDIFPASRTPKNLRHLVKPIYRSTSPDSRNSMKEKGSRIVTESRNLSLVLQQASDEEIRKMAYIQGKSVPHSNLGVLDKLIADRHEIAQIMGCKSYADYTLRSSMASSPEVVSSFLLEMSKTFWPKADEELKAIRNFKRVKSGQTSGDLKPWDVAYFTRLMKYSSLDLHFAVVASYFPLSQCIEGLKLLAESLFGVTFRSIPLAPGESWHPDVVKITLQHPHEGKLGYLYLDLKSRQGKYPGCAHFSVKGGRRISANEYQLPVVALVCNFSKSHNSEPVRLNHSDVETLFHEFGHALHSLLSRTVFSCSLQSNTLHIVFIYDTWTLWTHVDSTKIRVSDTGTRVVIDFSETPSNLFEYYAWDYRVLSKFAKHYSTGDMIPEKLVKSLQQARKMFSAIDLQEQIFFALMDQTLFGEQSTSADTISAVADLERQFCPWKHVEGTHQHTRFNHLLNYGAGYYSYLYAKCFASTIWEKVCKDDPLSLATGTAIRAKMLHHGGAKHPADMLTDLVGDGIIRHRDGGIVPDIASLCDEMDLTSR